jgi:hypothetical protein
MTDIIRRGDIVEYHGQRLKVVSDPYMFCGQMTVTAVTVAKKADQKGGLYAVSSLALVKPIEEDYDA